MNSADQIRDAAHRLGFVSVGFCRAESSRGLAAFRAWLAAGCHAEMRYLERSTALRADPRLLADGARSLVLAAARYPRHPDPGAGYSSYAWGSDYHDALMTRLQDLSRLLRQEYGAKVARCCVDSAPLLEREWAIRAGVGWKGKQGQVIHPDYGACLFLGAILTDLELPPAAPLPNRCGACRRCVAACPTAAIREDGTIDARRCISYLTVEHKGPIPAALRGALGQSLYGCDRCTAVCPWNRFGEETALPEFRPAHPLPDAAACLALTEADFRARFRGTSIRRTGLDRLQRNAAVVLGNGAPARGLTVLTSARARISSALVQEHIDWAIARLMAAAGPASSSDAS